MKRIFLIILLGILLALLLGTSVLEASPYALYIDPNAENASDKVTFIQGNNNSGPPQVWIKRYESWININPNAGSGN